MKQPSRVWVIGADDDDRRGQEVDRERVSPVPRRRGNHGAPAAHGREMSGEHRPHRDLLALLLLYVVGPLTILITRRQRRDWLWAGIGLAALTAAAWAVWHRSELLAWAGRSRASLQLVLIGLPVTVGLAFTAWGRAIAIFGRERPGWRERLPLWTHAPGLRIMVGLLVPGLGLMLGGRRRLAALGWWMAGPLVTAIALLAHAPALWRAATRSGSAAAHPWLEIVFLAGAGIFVLGALGWLVQALAGDRPQGRFSSGGVRTELLAAALLVSLLLFPVAFRPALLAGSLDDFAFSLRLEGLGVIPLCMSRAAAALDPAEPRYLVQVAEISEELGYEERADRIRQAMEARWRFATMRLRIVAGAVGAEDLTGGDQDSGAPGGPLAELVAAPPADQRSDSWTATGEQVGQ